MEDLFDEYMKNKPERLCIHCGKCKGNFPASPWEKLPDGCGYMGWFFQIREEIKQKIRKQKEDLLLLEIALKFEDTMQNDEINEKINNIKKNIELYAKYGSKNW